jgi:probable F420-dependent oxidoreductase
MTTYGITVMRGRIAEIAAVAAQAERSGYDTVWSPEFYIRSGVVTLAQIATATAQVRVGSSIAYAVGRSPLTIATEARSLDEVSNGRLVFGLGTGTKRMMHDWHGTDPTSPAPRMEELIPLLRRLWRLHEGPVRHEGRFYRVDVRPTLEVEPPLRPDIPIYTAGVNDRMVQVAGRVADGILGHVLFSPDYIEQFLRPAIAVGAARADRDPAAVAVCGLVIAAVSEDEEQARRDAAAQLAFYSAPKAYAPVLERQGFGPAGAAIRAAFEAGDHDAMVAAVPDAMIDTFAAAGTPGQVRERLNRFAKAVDHLIIYPPSFRMSAERCTEVLAAAVTHAAPR